jgi:hypothetical protein
MGLGITFPPPTSLHSEEWEMQNPNIMVVSCAYDGITDAMLKTSVSAALLCQDVIIRA